MNSDSTAKTWEKTRLQNMVRHKSEYYARLFLNGKEIWQSLKTEHFSVAEAKLAEVRKEHRQRRSKSVDPANLKMTFRQGAELLTQRVEANPGINSGPKNTMPRRWLRCSKAGRIWARRNCAT